MPIWKKISLSDRAEGDFVSVVSSYRQIRPSLGSRFFANVIRDLSRIQQFPKAHPKFNEQYRYLIMQDFPYFLIYIELENEIIVDAVANSHQNRDGMLKE